MENRRARATNTGSLEAFGLKKSFQVTVYLSVSPVKYLIQALFFKY